MELTKEEERLVLKFREEKKYTEERRLRQLKYLKTAYHFMEFLEQKEMDISFSLFLDDFGYQGKDAQVAFPVIQEIISLVRKF
jgi:hypothetical protein